jgi:hypothetical protein
MKTKPIRREQSSVACRTISVAAGKRCVLAAGRLRMEPQPDRNLLAAETPEKNQEAIIKGRVNVPKKREIDLYAAILARLRKELAKPHLTKSVREKATKKQIALWNAGR